MEKLIASAKEFLPEEAEPEEDKESMAVVLHSKRETDEEFETYKAQMEFLIAKAEGFLPKEEQKEEAKQKPEN